MATKFVLAQQGVTNLSTEAIVNGTNTAFVGKDGICQKAGMAVQQECQQYISTQSSLRVGQLFITKGGTLSAKHIIHIISPVWGDQDDATSAELLENCYKSALAAAAEQGIKVLGFPTISTGLERFPKKTAADCALKAVKEYMQEHPNSFQAIWFVCAETAEYKIYEKRWESFLKETAAL